MDTSATSDAVVLSLETRIVAVTVYTDQALITRRGKVTLTGHEQALTLTHLPLTLKPESVRAGGAGNVAVQLRAVQAERLFATEPVVDRIAQLTAQIEQLNDERQTISDRVAADTIQLNFVQGLSEKAVDRFSRSLAQQQVSLAETRNLLNFHRTTLQRFSRRDRPTSAGTTPIGETGASPPPAVAANSNAASQGELLFDRRHCSCRSRRV